MLLNEDVVWAYRTLLHRKPENKEIVLRWVQTCPNVRELVERFLTSEEYSRLISTTGLGKRTMMYHRTAYGFLHPVDISDRMMIRHYVDQTYEQKETECIAGLLRPGDYCVDLGARHGWFTSLMASIVGQTGYVWAFEPDSSLDYVQLAVEANGYSNVNLVRKGASDVAGVILFDPESASLGAGPVSIETVRLDDALRNRPKPIRLMKIDIEGSEYKALEGASEILTADRPLIVMEMADELQRRVSGVPVTDCVRLLRKFGYIPSDMSGRAVSEKWINDQIADASIFNLLFTPVARPD